MNQITIEELDQHDNKSCTNCEHYLEDLSMRELQIKGGIIQPDNPSGLDPTVFNPDLLWIVY
jgi:hypothetical protein